MGNVTLILVLIIMILSLLLMGCSDNCSVPDSTGVSVCTEDDDSSSDGDGGSGGGGSGGGSDDDGSWLDIFIIFDGGSDDSDGGGGDSGPSCEIKPKNESCFSSSGVQGEIKVRAASKGKYTLKKIEIFEGNFENGNNLTHIDVDGKFKFHNVNEGDISATALYVSETDSILAVDGTKVTFKSKSYCDLKCYYVEPIYFDLTLN